MLHKNLTAYFKTNLKFKALCIDMLSRQYAFRNNQIISYSDVLNFKESYLTHNKCINWDVPTIEAVKDKIDWSGFYKINGVELNLSFFKKYNKHIHFKTIHLNQNIDWSNELLDTYAELWDWESLMSKPIVALSRNIEKYSTNYNWDKFSTNRYLILTEELIDTYIDNWNWVKLSSNSTLKLNKKGIEKYKDKLCFNGLSRNAAMVPFILAYPYEYNWNWNAFIQNPSVVFSDTLVKFLMTKLKAEMSMLKYAPEETKNELVLANMTLKACNNPNFDRTNWFSKKIPWKQIIPIRPELLTTEEIEENLDLNDFNKIIPHKIIEKLSKEYILNNKEALLKFRWSLYRNGAIDADFVETNNESSDWFQLAFNEQFNWSLEFLIKYLEKFESNFGLSQNKKLFEVLFGEATSEEIDELLKLY